MSSIVAMPNVVTDPLTMAYADGDTAQSPKLRSIRELLRSAPPLADTGTTSTRRRQGSGRRCVEVSLGCPSPERAPGTVRGSGM